ncbi:MAG: DUF5667 domain-containing protein [Actinomycetota bacterium]|nr:DUF5667 domain-containing protein [Actinomycetota bacterium]
MNALLPAHRRAEKFAALVDTSSTIAADGRDAEFLAIVEVLRGAAAEAPEPRPDFVTSLRDRLMVEADTALVPTDRRLVLPQHAGRRQNRLTAVAAALVIVGGTAGVSVAAQGSLPGDALYPLKRGIEQVTETFSFSDAARGQDLLHQADSRLSEVSSMLGNGASDASIAETMHNFATSAGQGADLLFTSYQRNGDDASVSAVRDFAGTDMGELTDLAHRAPRSLQADFAQAAQLLADLDQQARVLCAECGTRDPLTLPSDLALVASDGLSSLLNKPNPAVRLLGTAGGQPGAGATQPAGRPASGGSAAAPKVTLPDLSALFGRGAGHPGSGGSTSGSGASVGASNPLGQLLNAKPGSTSTSVPGLGKLGKHLTHGVDQATGPLLKPKKP